MNRASQTALVGAIWLSSMLFLPTHGTIDVDRFWLPWMAAIEEFGLRPAYALAKSDYPPLAFVGLDGVRLVAVALNVSHHAALKVVLWAMLGGSTLVYYRFSRQALLTAVFCASLTLNSVGLAYLDILLVPTLVGAFMALRSGHTALGLLLFTASVLIKFQPIILAPVVCVYLIRSGQLDTRVLWPAVALVALTLGVFGTEVLQAFARAGDHRALSAQALNLWWVVSYVIQQVFLAPPASELTLVAAPPPFLFAVRVVVVLAYAWMLARWRPLTFPALLQASSLGYALYVGFGPGVHENHWLILVVMLGLVASETGEWREFAIFSVLANANLWLFYGLSGIRPVWTGSVWTGLAMSTIAVLTTLSLWRFVPARRVRSTLNPSSRRPVPVGGG